MSPPRLVALDGPPHQVYAVNSTDARFLCREIFEGGSYEAELPPAPTILDVGANIGVFALWARARHPGATIHCFEPVPELVDALHRNLELHGAEAVVHPVAVGAARSGPRPFRYFPVSPSSSTFHPESLDRHKEQLGQHSSAVVERMFRGREILVPTERLSDHLPRIGRVHLLKVDVVGAELDVLRGIEPKHWAALDRVVIDVQDVADRVGELRSLLERRGLAVEVARPPFADLNDDLNRMVVAVRS